MEAISIIVVTRDRFSTTARCLETLIANTPEPSELIVVMGQVPNVLQAAWQKRFGAKALFHFQPKLLNPSQLRNIGLKHAKTRLSVLLDNDVYVRPNWLPPLLDCQAKTNAAMVVPIVLDSEEGIHTAGNDLLITYRNGKAFGQKVLRYIRKSYWEGSNLKRQPTEYGELHCQLVVTETALRLGVYDEHFLEVGEVDSGLTWAKAGCSMWFEPASVVHFDYPDRIRQVEDIRPFMYKWNMDGILKGYQYFEKKWGLDITECGQWSRFNVTLNEKLGLLSRLWPSRVSLALDNAYTDLRRFIVVPFRLWANFKAWIFGYYRWQKSAAAAKNRS